MIINKGYFKIDKRKLLLLDGIIFSLLFFPLISKADYTVTGIIIDQATKKPVPGASISIINTTRGTYSSSSGKFRLPFLNGIQKLKINSIGYESTTVVVSEKHHDSLSIKIKQSSVNLNTVEKTGEIEADEIVKRAIERKHDNLSRLKTFKGLLYSKLVFELGGSAFAAASGGSNNIAVTATIGSRKVDSKYKMFVLETFSNVMKDYEKNITRTTIIQRRQTSNLQPGSNLLAIGEFINFYDETIKFFNVDMVTPLSKNALSYYQFKLLKKEILDDRYVYDLQVIPASDLYPLFVGTMKIVEGTYNLVELDLKPSKNTAISFVRDVSLNQKFTEVKKDIWQPSYLEATGKARVEVVKGMFDLDLDVTATSIFNELTVNEPLPDSIYQSEQPRRVTVEKTADSAKPEFWEKNSMREITPREKDMYKTVDSLVAHSDSVKVKESGFNWNLMPAIEFNRVGSAILGVNPSFSYRKISLDATGAFSFGLQRPLGDVTLKIPLYDTTFTSFSLTGQVFSQLGTCSRDESQIRLINSIAAALLHTDYYDYLRKDGWSGGFSSRYRRFGLSGEVELTRQISLLKTTNRSIFSKSEWRNNPTALEGNFRTAELNFTYGNQFRVNFSKSIQTNLTLNALYGEETTTKASFRLAEGNVNFDIPLIYTGYMPISLKLIAQGGIGSANLPLQYSFRQPTRLTIIGMPGNFYSAPIGKYGGNSYYSGHAILNLTDIWWRAIGLPLYEGRGLDLSLAASSGRFFSQNVRGYQPTGNNFYSEAGFGLEKIPTFVSNVIFLSFDARWGLGPLATGLFGWAVGISAPF